MRNLSICLALVGIVSSCIFIHYDDSKDLGKGFYYVPDGNYSSIVKSVREKYEGIGEEIIPPKVIDYKFNEKFIIAKTVNVDGANDEIKYWIVDKSSSSKVYPLDSLSFHEKNRNTGLTF
jgi:hypothetical protein